MNTWREKVSKETSRVTKFHAWWPTTTVHCSVNAFVGEESDGSNARDNAAKKRSGRLRNEISFRGKRYVSRADSYGRWSMRVTDARLIFLCSRLQRHGFPLLCRNAIAGSCLCPASLRAGNFCLARQTGALPILVSGALFTRSSFGLSRVRRSPH